MLRAWQSPLNLFYKNPGKENERLFSEKIFGFFICLTVVLYESDFWLDISVSAGASSIHTRQSTTSNL